MTTTVDVRGVVPTFTLADRLRKAREFSGLEQGELAERMGVGRSTISNNERGLVTPRRIVLNAWALATGVSLEWLKTGIAPVLPDEGDAACAIRDSNPEPAGLKHRVATVVELWPAA